VGLSVIRRLRKEFSGRVCAGWIEVEVDFKSDSATSVYARSIGHPSTKGSIARMERGPERL
jgi:hypothetical protein